MASNSQIAFAPMGNTVVVPAASTAATGSLYTNTAGGANTTLYIKESGAGNTGWVAK